MAADFLRRFFVLSNAQGFLQKIVAFGIFLQTSWKHWIWLLHNCNCEFAFKVTFYTKTLPANAATFIRPFYIPPLIFLSCLSVCLSTSLSSHLSWLDLKLKWQEQVLLWIKPLWLEVYLWILQQSLCVCVYLFFIHIFSLRLLAIAFCQHLLAAEYNSAKIVHLYLAIWSGALSGDNNFETL